MTRAQAPRAPTPQDRRIAWALFAGAFGVLWATQSDVGFVRDESLYFVAGDSYADWFRLLWVNPAYALSDAGVVRFFDINHEHPVLMKSLFGASSLFFHRALEWLRPAVASRLPAFAAAALIPSLVYLFGTALYGRGAGLFAALSFLAVPRQFFNAHLACFDIPIAAAWLLTVYAFWRAQTDRGWWALCGVAFGLALATKHNALFLPAVLFPFAWVLAFRASHSHPESRQGVWRWTAVQVSAVLLFGILWGVWGEARFVETFLPLSPQVAIYLLALGASGALALRLRHSCEGAFRPLAAVTAMEGLGPLLFYALWPYLWHHPVERTAWYLHFHAQHNNYVWFYLGRLLREPPFPLDYVVVVTALTVPLSLFVPMTLGLASVLGRAVLAGIGRLRALFAPVGFGEALVLVNAIASIALISHPDVPHFGGVKHWFPSMPFLSILAGHSASRAARAMAELLRKRWPSVKEAVASGGLFSLLLLPAVWATAHVHPYGTSAYSELAGGIPGAASLGMQRQFWSNNVTGVLPWLNANAPEGARVWLHEVTYYAFRQYQENGMLRSDLIPVGGPADADFAAYQYHQEFREQEMNIWQAFGTRRPAFGLFLDETPQVIVYRRP